MDTKYYDAFLDKAYEPQGLSMDYPIPVGDGILFFIQRNHNYNTVVYEINTNAQGNVFLDEPMKVYWIKYNDRQEVCELNYIQNKLAYGYKSRVINDELIEFKMVCYDKTFFISKIENEYKIITKINGLYSCLDNVFVYAEEFGVFPDVKFIDLYGTKLDGFGPCFERIVF